VSDYGIAYMGSKAKIAASIALNFPPAENFYDLFGGGFAMSHYMLERKANRYKHFHYNEIKADVVDIVKRAISGKFNYSRFKPAWVSREEFYARKETDVYIRCIWSFGNNQSSYLFGPDIEAYKGSMHQAVVFDEFDDLAKKTLGFDKWPAIAKTITQKRLYLRQKVAFTVKGSRGELERLQQLQQLERLEQLQQLERLEQLQQLEGLERLHFYATDYREVPIKENSVVYCDIPYSGTACYGNNFNQREFYDWAESRPFPVFISEYSMPASRFKLVYSIDKRSMLSQDKSVGDKSENLYWNGVAL
jgi:hypothetical protein